MTPALPRPFDDVGECVEATLRRVGSRVVLGAPLGIGKPNHLLNEFYRRAGRDPSLRLTIFTALSLNRPTARSELEARFLEPFVARVFGDYVDLDYVKAAHAGRLPPNVEIREFYLQAGAWLGCAPIQQDYLSANYSHAARDLLAAGANVIAQQVAVRPGGSREEVSLCSNPDLTLDLLPEVDRLRAGGRDVVLVGSVNRRMPFMGGDAAVPAGRFDFLLDHPRYDYDPYVLPAAPIGTVEHAIGLNASALVRDGGTLQLGIGELGDAVVYSLQLRQQQNAAWRGALDALGTTRRFGDEVGALGGLAALDRGLYACTEMFVDGFLDLYRCGVLKRPVYPHAVLQRLLDDGTVTERLDVETLVALARAGVTRLDAAAFAALEACGLFQPGTRFEPGWPGRLLGPDGERVAADFGDPAAREAIARSCLARRLDGGLVLHAAFFLGPRGFYGGLAELPEADRRRFAMTRVSWTNEAGGADHALRAAQRRHARFMNTTMMVTALGAAVSDGLADGQVVSGVGGQYNFVAQAHALPEGRSLLLLRSTRTHDGTTRSNVVWNYGHVTIPRHLRDVVVTEYGVAALRGCTDRECIARLLAVTDSRFQDSLLAEAKRAGKIEAGYRIPDEHRANRPDALEAALRAPRAAGLFTHFPFGSEFTAEELVLRPALERLEREGRSLLGRAALWLRARRAREQAAELRPYLQRMRLDRPADDTELRLARLVALAVDDELAAQR